MENEGKPNDNQNPNAATHATATETEGNRTHTSGNQTPSITYEDDGKIMVVDGKRFVVQDHVNTLVGSARTEGKNAGKTEAEKAAERQREQDRNNQLTEQGQYKDLWTDEKTKRETAEARVVELEGQIQESRLNALRSKIAKEFNIPEGLADRIRGDDEAAMRADATEVAKNVAPPKAPETQTGNNGNTNANETRNDGDNTPKDRATNQNRTYAFQSAGEVKW